jgi:hypothetical protein
MAIPGPGHSGFMYLTESPAYRGRFKTGSFSSMSFDSVNRVDYLWASGLFLLCLVLILLYGSWGKPIWIDEFLHFALGSHQSTGEAWETIRQTTLNINHGQTGFYMLLDYWLMKIFGANLLALRAPSILSTFWLLLSGFLILRTRGFHWSWMYLLVFCLMGQLTLMGYVAEARPYMPLAAASSGTLAYYLQTLEHRQQRWLLWFGAISIVWGVLMHPYFAVYWAVLWVFAYWHHYYSGNLQIGVRSILVHVNLPLTIIGTVLFFLLGTLTWMRSGPEFDLDPFQWIAADGYWKTFFDIGLFQFLRPLGIVVTGLLLVLLLVFLVLPARAKSRLKPLISPLLLIIAMLVVTGFLTFVSMHRDYWVLPRQWVASIALVAIGFVWFIAEISRLQRGVGGVVFIACLLYFSSLVTPSAIITKVEQLENALTGSSNLAKYSQGQPSNIALPVNNEEWVALASMNIQAGGAVWPIFRKFYGLKE